MPELPSNSQKHKTPTPTENPAPGAPPKPVDEDEEKAKIEKVIKSQAIKRKKPLGSRMKELFFGGSSRGAWDYVAYDVLIPAAKDMFADAVSQGVERIVFGDARSTSRRTGRRPGEPGPRVSYNKMYDTRARASERRPQLSRRARASHDFDEIILSTRMEADEVLDRLYDLISKYEVATVADLYDLVGVSGNYTDNKWGWFDLRGAGIARVRQGYLLDLPRTEPIE